MSGQSVASVSSLSLSRQGQESEVAGFILKTFQILGVQEYQKIIYWASNGLEFIIKDVVKFEEIVLPHYFRHNKINSFVRQLNMYGFHKIKHNSFKSTFRHEHFQKGRDDLLPLIRRKPKGNDRDGEDAQLDEPRPHPLRAEKTAQPAQEQQVTLSSEKWASITQEFLATTKMINLSLVKVSYNQLSQAEPLFGCPEEGEECASIEDELAAEERASEVATGFQNPTCFLAWQFGSFQ